MRVGYFVIWHPELGMLFERGTMHGRDVAAAMFQESTNLTMRATKIVFLASDGTMEVIKDRHGPHGPLAVGPAVGAQECSIPHPGWWCSRGPGHGGPCAAYDPSEEGA